jgi:uncharacterized protein
LVVQNVVLLDTGPLVAALARDDRAHPWAKEQFETFGGPFFTSEAVVTEACHLLRRTKRDSSAVLRLLESGALRLGMDLEEEVSAVRKLFERYRNVPATLADACLVRIVIVADAKRTHGDAVPWAARLESEILPFWTDACGRSSSIELDNLSPNLAALERMRSGACGRASALQTMIVGLRRNSAAEVKEAEEQLSAINAEIRQNRRHD